ncbi:MAG: cyclic nucleotide-binding domain-containing protein [Actinomycetota bacterium]|nr:cyclic nucleotide-binding domain-containing protein [Actinomycetota bacterium]
MIKHGDRLTAVSGVSLFQGLSKADLKRVLKEFEEQSFSEGQTIVAEGQSGGRFYVVLNGRVDVVIGGKKKKQLSSGASFGEMSLIDSQPRSATVIAATHVDTLAIASWNFLALLEENFTITKKVMGQLTKRVRELDKALTD